MRAPISVVVPTLDAGVGSGLFPVPCNARIPCCHCYTLGAIKAQECNSLVVRTGKKGAGKFSVTPDFTAGVRFSIDLDDGKALAGFGFVFHAG